MDGMMDRQKDKDGEMAEQMGWMDTQTGSIAKGMNFYLEQSFLTWLSQMSIKQFINPVKAYTKL